MREFTRTDATVESFGGGAAWVVLPLSQRGEASPATGDDRLDAVEPAAADVFGFEVDLTPLGVGEPLEQAVNTTAATIATIGRGALTGGWSLGAVCLRSSELIVATWPRAVLAWSPQPTVSA